MHISCSLLRSQHKSDLNTCLLALWDKPYVHGLAAYLHVKCVGRTRRSTHHVGSDGQAWGHSSLQHATGTFLFTPCGLSNVCCSCCQLWSCTFEVQIATSERVLWTSFDKSVASSALQMTLPFFEGRAWQYKIISHATYVPICKARPMCIRNAELPETKIAWAHVSEVIISKVAWFRELWLVAPRPFRIVCLSPTHEPTCVLSDSSNNSSCAFTSGFTHQQYLHMTAAFCSN